ncbi:MAG: cupin domain-containing protein [Gammaproteobacteria bacterium]
MVCRVRPVVWLATIIFLGIVLACSLSVSRASQVNPVMPAQERSTEAAEALGGPKESRGILSVRTMGSNSLGKDFTALAGRSYRVREITVAPDGVVAAHQHKQRPGVAYIVEGEIMEFRSDETAPILRKAGDVVFEKSGMAHWWHNQSNQPAKAIVMDIVPDSELSP